MSDERDAMVEERLSVFDDEPDLNDWVEVMCGAAMAVLGIFHLVEPGNLVDPDIMRWFAAAVVAAGAVWQVTASKTWPSKRSVAPSLSSTWSTTTRASIPA